MPPATAIDQIPALLAQADQLRQQAATLQPEVDRLQRRIDRLSADITDLESQLIEPPLTNRDAKKNARLRERIADIQARRDGIQQQLDPLLAEQSSLLDQADALTAQANQRQTEATALQTQATQLRANATQYDANAQQEDTLALQAETQAAEYRRLAQNNPPAEPVETHFVYNSDGQLIYEHDNRTGKTVEHLYLDATPIAFNCDGQLYFIHTDHLGTPRVVTDNAQRTVWEWYSTPFGVNAANEDADGDGTKVTLNLRFPGQYFDTETELHYNYFRTYDPSTGRYIESDPIGLTGGLNTFLYANANPMSFVDPLGLETTVVCRPIRDWRASMMGMVHCAVFVWHWDNCDPKKKVIDRQYSLAGNRTPFPQNSTSPTFVDDTNSFNSPGGRNSHYPIHPPFGVSQSEFDQAVMASGNSFSFGENEKYDAKSGPNSNTATDNIIEGAGGVMPNIPGAWQQNYGE